MNRTILSLVLITSILLFAGRAFACDFCLLSQGISPLDSMKGSGIKISERFTVLDKLYTGTGEQQNPGARETHWTTELTGFYGITSDLTVLAVLPYKKGRTTGEAEMTAGAPELDTAMAGDASGVGDAVLLGRYAFLKREGPEATTVIAGIAGIKFNTGRTNARTADGMSYLDSHLQPGTGSTDYVLGISASHALNRFSLSANLLGTVTNEGRFGSSTHQFGNALNYDVNAKYRVAPEAFMPAKPQWFLALGVNGEVRGKEKVDHVTVQDSGGNTAYLSPGLQVVFAPHWVAEMSYQQAVYHNLKGTQLGETYRTVTAVTYLF